MDRCTAQQVRAALIGSRRPLVSRLLLEDTPVRDPWLIIFHSPVDKQTARYPDCRGPGLSASYLRFTPGNVIIRGVGANDQRVAVDDKSERCHRWSVSVKSPAKFAVVCIVFAREEESRLLGRQLLLMALAAPRRQLHYRCRRWGLYITQSRAPWPDSSSPSLTASRRVLLTS